MVIDTSVILTILQNEPEAAPFVKAILLSPKRSISCACVLEASIIIWSRFGEDGLKDLELLLSKLKLESSAFTPEQATLAFRAYKKFGKGHHAAKLNFGDCFSYGLAKLSGDPLLFKGDDFSKADITAAIY